MARYDPESYWSRVGLEIDKRGQNYLAGDDNPLLRYKREKFLRDFLDQLDFADRTVLEVGCGPGGNLKRIVERHRPKRVIGIDIADAMCALAARNLRDRQDVAEIHKTDGRTLPLADRSVDLSYTVTVLQHVTDAAMCASLIDELCRVTRDRVVVMEDIGSTTTLGGQGSWVGRTIGVYESAFTERGYALVSSRFLGTAVSRRWYHPLFTIYRHVINRRHQEGDPMHPMMRMAIGAPLIVTRQLDRVVPDRRDLAQLVFRRVASAP